MTEDILSSINPHDLDGLVIDKVVDDKQYNVQTQLKKPLILENKHDLGKSVDDLMAFYNPNKYSDSGARVQTNSTAKIDPENRKGLVGEPDTVDNTPYWHEQLKKPLVPENRSPQNDLMNVQTELDSEKYKVGNLSKNMTAIRYVIAHQNASKNSTPVHLFEKNSSKNVSKNAAVQKNVTANHTSNMTKNVTANATLSQKNISANKTANKTVNLTKNMTANATKSSLKNVTSQYFNVTISQKNVSANVTMVQKNANKTSNTTANKTANASKNASTPVIK